MAKLTVWGGNECGQWRTIVAVGSKAALRNLMGTSRGETDRYWQETGNDAETTLALSVPGALWHKGTGMWWWPPGEDWHEGRGIECLRCRSYILGKII